MKQLIPLILIFSFFSCREQPDSEIKYFENYDLASGKYKILFYREEGPLLDDYTDFYIDDIETLKKYKHSGCLI